MAILSNINDLFRIDSAGAVYFATSAGANLQVLQSVGTGGSPIWVDVDDIIGGPYLPLTGGTLTGNLAISGSNSLSVGGALTGASATFTGTVLIDGVSNYTGLVVKGSGASRPAITWSNVNQGDLGIIYGTENNALVIATGASGLAALTLDSSQNATFAGDVHAGGRLRSSVGSDSGSQLNLWADSNGHTFLAGYDFAIYTGLNNARTQSFKIDYLKAATFSGKITAPTLSIQNQINTTSSNLEMNYANGDGTTTNFKDFYIRDGKNAVILNIQGSSKNASFAGNITVGAGNSTFGGVVTVNNPAISPAITAISSWSGTTRNPQIKFARIASAVAGEIGYSDPETNLYIGSTTNHDFRIRVNNNDIITCDTAQNVGIGATSPEQKLHVEGRGIFDGGTSSDILQIRNDNGGGVFGMTSNLFALDLASTSAFRIRQGSSVPFYLKSDGNVGIGTTSPANKLDVEGRIQGDNFVLGGSDSTVFYGMYRAGTETREVRLVSYEATPNSKVQLGMSNLSGSSYTFAPALTVKANLRVGVGTIDPLNILHIKDTGVIFRIEDTVQGLIGFIGDANAAGEGADGDFGIRTTNNLSFMVGGSTERMRILANGNVIIGTETSTACTLKVSSTKNGSASSPHFCLTGNGYTALHWLDTTAYNIVTNSASRDIRISANSNGVKLTPGATAWVSNSDIALKENLRPLENVLDKIKDYRCVEYNLKNSAEDKKIGFIAQDWVDDFPAIVDKDEKDMLGMKYTETIPVLLKAIQELTARVKELENK